MSRSSSKKTPTRDAVKLINVTYLWTPESSPLLLDKTEPTIADRGIGIRLPRLHQTISWFLPRPQTAGQEPPIILAYGKVTAIQPGELPVVSLRRVRTAGLTYDELCACIGARVVGYHPVLGSIEGELMGILPNCELAGIFDTAQLPLLKSDDSDATGDDEPVVWVDWATIWTVAGLEIMAAAGTKHGRTAGRI